MKYSLRMALSELESLESKHNSTVNFVDNNGNWKGSKRDLELEILENVGTYIAAIKESIYKIDRLIDRSDDAKDEDARIAELNALYNSYGTE